MSAEPQSSYLAVRSQAFAGVRALLTRTLLIAGMSAIGTTWLIRRLGPTAWGGFLVSFGLLVACDMVLTRCLLVGLMPRSEPTAGAPLPLVPALVAVAGAPRSGIVVVLSLVVPTWCRPPHLRLLL